MDHVSSDGCIMYGGSGENSLASAFARTYYPKSTSRTSTYKTTHTLETTNDFGKSLSETDSEKTDRKHNIYRKEHSHLEHAKGISRANAKNALSILDNTDSAKSVIETPYVVGSDETITKQIVYRKEYGLIEHWVNNKTLGTIKEENTVATSGRKGVTTNDNDKIRTAIKEENTVPKASGSRRITATIVGRSTLTTSGTRNSKGTIDTKDSKSTKDTDTKDTKDTTGTKGTEDRKSTKDSKDTKGTRYTKYTICTKCTRCTKYTRDTRSTRGTKDVTTFATFQTNHRRSRVTQEDIDRKRKRWERVAERTSSYNYFDDKWKQHYSTNDSSSEEFEYSKASFFTKVLMVVYARRTAQGKVDECIEEENPRHSSSCFSWLKKIF